MSENFIAIDWGSTNLRAWLYVQGLCVDFLSSESGVTRLQGQTPQQVFSHLMQPWFQDYGDLPAIMAGMVGSNARWQVVPYLSCPVALGEVTQHLTTIRSPNSSVIHIIPGLCINRPDNSNVMRGEETQIIGAHQLHKSSRYLMPGTHSKWVQMSGDYVDDFRTVITGELHYLLLQHGLIGIGIGEQHVSQDAFQQGLDIGFNDAGVIRNLFEVRAAHLLGKRSKGTVSDWLSGVLIGNEIAQMQQTYALHASDNVTLIGSPKLNERYATALNFAGIAYQTIDGDIAFQTGIRSIANALGY